MFAGKKSAQIREILINESAWEEMTCLFAPSLDLYGISSSNAVDGLTVRDLLHKYLNDQMPEVKQTVLKDMC